jgi:hypothetical protein
VTQNADGSLTTCVTDVNGVTTCTTAGPTDESGAGAPAGAPASGAPVQAGFGNVLLVAGVLGAVLYQATRKRR